MSRNSFIKLKIKNLGLGYPASSYIICNQNKETEIILAESAKIALKKTKLQQPIKVIDTKSIINRAIINCEMIDASQAPE